MSIKSTQEMALDVPEEIETAMGAMIKTAFCQTVWRELGHIELKDGRIAEVQILITTDGDEWLDHTYADQIFGEDDD